MNEGTIAHYLGWRIYRRSNSPSLWVEGWHMGRRHRESVKSDRTEAARRLIKKRVNEIARRGKVTGPEIERTTYNDLERLLLDDLEANQRRYLATIPPRLVYLKRAFGHVPALDITHDKLNAYKAHRLRQGAAAATVKMELALLHRAFVLALKANRVERVPPFPTVEVDNARSGFCSPEEIEKVIAHLPEHVAPVVRMLYLTGMRKGEALSLRWSRVDFDAQVIALRPQDTKTKRGRTIPFGRLRPLAELLAHQLERVRAMGRETGRIIPEVFPDVSPVTLKRWWHRAVKKAGLPWLRPHDLRRSFVRNLVRAGVPETVAMALTGHRTRAMFDRYNIHGHIGPRGGRGQAGGVPRKRDRHTQRHTARDSGGSRLGTCCGIWSW